MSTLLGALVLGSSVAAQISLPEPGDGGTANPFLDVNGDLRTPGSLAGEFVGWTVLPELGAAFQFFDTNTSDPGVQFVVAPGFSGHPTKWERFRLQFPHPAPPRVTDSALVIAFHGFSVSEADIWSFSSFPDECASRGYYLLAPLGLDGENWASTESQVVLDTVLDLIQTFFEINTERVYTAGFSMGGCNALSYALRHQDPDGLRVAGVISHTSTIDLVDNYNQSPANIQVSMQSGLGGTPVTAASEYQRVSPMLTFAGAPDPDYTNVSNLLHVPFYYHVNLFDTETVLLAQNAIFKNWLISSGATASINEVALSSAPKHSWNTMDHQAALDFVDGFTLPAPPDRIEFFADRTEDYLYTELRAIAANEVARYHVDIDAGANSFTFDETKHVDEIAFDLAVMGLDPTKALDVTHETIDATSDSLVLKGYVNPPSSVLVGGLAPSSWSHDSLAQELTVVPNLTGALATVALGTPVPAPSFSASVLSGPAPLTVDFTDSTWGCVSGWTWDFGDTGSDTLQNPQHIYTTPGVYTVQLSVTGPGGIADDTKVAYITVFDPLPVPEFGADVTSGDAPLAVQFTDLSTGVIGAWSWDFGDGNSSTAQDPPHTYLTPGTYTVALTTTGPGGSTTETKTDLIVVSDSTPVADFSADLTSGDAPLTVQFTDASSGTINSRDWDFGDGGTSTAIHPQYTFNTPGTYTVVLDATGPGGSDTATKVDYITVTEAPPTANFTSDVVSGVAPLTVNFTDLTTGGVPFQWDWTFGDLGTSTAQNPQHIYTAPGTYTVVLAVTAASGSDVEVKVSYITVN